MTQIERNRKVHEEVIREFRALGHEERVKRLIACGILTKDGKLAPRYGGPVDDEGVDVDREPRAS
ncbi:MAG: hypothetical protein R3F62_27410 [Planctomycetota bacterium]